MSRFETAKCVFSPSRKARNHGIIGQLSSGIQNLIAQSSQTDEDEDRLVAHSNEILFAKIFRTHTSVRVLLATKSLLHVWSVSGWERDSAALEPERSTVIKTSEGRAFIDACMFGDSRICTIEGSSKSTHIRTYDTTGEVLCEQMMSGSASGIKSSKRFIFLVLEDGTIAVLCPDTLKRVSKDFRPYIAEDISEPVHDVGTDWFAMEGIVLCIVMMSVCISNYCNKLCQFLLSCSFIVGSVEQAWWNALVKDASEDHTASIDVVRRAVSGLYTTGGGDAIELGRSRLLI